MGSYSSGAGEHYVSPQGGHSVRVKEANPSEAVARVPRVQWDACNWFALQFSPLSGDKLICTWAWAVTAVGAAVSLEDEICWVEEGRALAGLAVAAGKPSGGSRQHAPRDLRLHPQALGLCFAEHVRAETCRQGPGAAGAHTRAGLTGALGS